MFKLTLAIALYVSLFFMPNLGLDRLFVCGIPLFLFFVLIVKTFQSHKVPHFLVVLGNISYSMYLLNTFVLTAFSKLVYDIETKVTLASFFASIVAIALLIACSYLSWYLVENKLSGWLKILVIGGAKA